MTRIVNRFGFSTQITGKKIPMERILEIQQKNFHYQCVNMLMKFLKIQKVVKEQSNIHETLIN